LTRIEWSKSKTEGKDSPGLWLTLTSIRNPILICSRNAQRKSSIRPYRNWPSSWIKAQESSSISSSETSSIDFYFFTILIQSEVFNLSIKIYANPTIKRRQ
jgi:hypothetical protein